MNPSARLPLLCTAFLPPIAYMATIANNGGACIEAHENFVKQSYRNRVRIMTDQGVRDLSIPVLHGHGDKVPVRMARTDEHLPWRRNLWRALAAAYNRSPFFMYYGDELKEIVLNGSPVLFDLNQAALQWLIRSLKLEVLITNSSEFQAIADFDFRGSFHPKRVSPAAPVYWQTFGDRQGFVSDLSCIDLLFNLGPEARNYLLTYGKSLANHSG
jgi:hypothetical protein